MLAAGIEKYLGQGKTVIIEEFQEGLFSLEDQLNVQYQRWIRHNEKYEAREIKKEIADFQNKPFFSILVDASDSNYRQMNESLESCDSQHYRHYEVLVICRPDKKTRPNASRVSVKPSLKSAVDAAKGDYCLMMVSGDRLNSLALYDYAVFLNVYPRTALVYGDHDYLGKKGERQHPIFKPAFNHDMLLACNYIQNSFVIRKEILAALLPSRTRDYSTLFHDLLLRVSEEHQLLSIPKVVMHKRLKKGGNGGAAGFYEASRKAIEDSLERRSKEGVLKKGLIKGTYRVCWKIKSAPLLSVIIPTGLIKPSLLFKCLTAIARRTSYKNKEIIIVNNNGDPAKLRVMIETADIQNDLRIIEYNHCFNYSAMCNLAARKAKGSQLLFLNDDVEPLNSDWLEALLEQSERPEVGCVGAKLVYPDLKTIQHAGVVTGGDFVAMHVFRNYPEDSEFGFAPINLIRNVSAVTGACLMTKKIVFRKAGGMDDCLFRIEHGDVDYCLKIRRQGLSVVFTPYAKLIHHESVSSFGHERKYEGSRSSRYMRHLWEDMLVEELFFNENLRIMFNPFDCRSKIP